MLSKMRVVVIAAVLAAGASGCNEKKGKVESESAAKPAARPPDPNAPAVDVTARRLFEDYAENEVGADEKYKGKVLRVTGIVARIVKQADGTAFVDFQGRITVKAHMVGLRGVGDLKPYQDATVRCIGDGKYGGPWLADCALEVPAADAAPADAAQQPAPGEVHVAAIDLVSDYKANDISADDKYRNRTLIVTGVLGSVGKGALGMDEPDMAMFTTSRGDVVVHLAGAATALKSGKGVTLRCIGKGFEMVMPILGDCVVEK